MNRFEERTGYARPDGRITQRHEPEEGEGWSYDRALSFASHLSDTDLKRHWSVSTNNRHQCRDCFCCACGEVLRNRRAAQQAR